jgi:transcriptional regulator with XRE-family HTH domain
MLNANRPLIVGVMLFAFGTSSAYGAAIESGNYGHYRRGTSTGVFAAISAASAISELRRLTGFTWEQLARLVGVSRRSLHFWANGKEMAAANEERLWRILAVVRTVDCGSPAANRAWLLSTLSDGAVPFELLAGGKYERLAGMLGQTRPAIEAALHGGDKGTHEAGTASPNELVDALQDRVHLEIGKTRVAKGMKTRGIV